MNRLLEDIGLRFVSGNSVPVERATLTRAEYDQLRALLSAQEPKAVEGEGRDALWTWFGLSYAAWLVLPRVMMHAMPDEWQAKMADLLTQWNATWRNMPDVATSVTLRSHGKIIPAPDYLTNYRYPDTDALESMKAQCPRELAKQEAK